MTKIVPESIMTAIKKDVEDANKSLRYYSECSNDESYNSTTQLIFSGLAVSNARAAMHNTCIYLCFEGINNITEILAQLPKDNEFAELRAQIEDTRTKTIQTLMPIKEFFEKAKAAEENSKRSEQIYG